MTTRNGWGGRALHPHVSAKDFVFQPALSAYTDDLLSRYPEGEGYYWQWYLCMWKDCLALKYILIAICINSRSNYISCRRHRLASHLFRACSDLEAMVLNLGDSIGGTGYMFVEYR